MRTGIEYLSSNTAIAYPFRDDALALVYENGTVVHGAAATMPTDVFVDALANMPSSVTNLYLYSMTLNGTLLTAVFNDQLAQPVLQATVDLSGMAATPVFQTVIFEHASVPCWIKLVVNMPLFLAWASAIPGTDIYGGRLPVSGAAVEAMENRVMSLQLYDDGLTNPATSPRIVDRITIIPGYNMVIEQDITNEQVDTNVLDLDVQAGAGAGLAPCDETVPVPQPKKMGIQADSAGNVNVEPGDDCYNVTPVPESGIIVIEGVCTACCTCTDYENVLTALDNLFHKAKCAHCYLRDGHDGPNALAADHCVGGTITQCGPVPSSSLDPFFPASAGEEASYTNGVTIFNTVIAPKRGIPVLTVNGMRGARYYGTSKRRTGAPNFVTFVASIKNNYREPIRVKLDSFAYNADLNSGDVGETVQVAWEYNRACPDKASEQDVPKTTTPTPIARGQTCQVYIYMKSSDDLPLASAKITVTVDVETLDTVHSWSLSAETCV